MLVPLQYNLRNLRVRWLSTLATVTSLGLVVAVFVLVLALARGLRATYLSTGDPRNLLVLRKGSMAESSSQISGIRFWRASSRRRVTFNSPVIPIEPAITVKS